MGLLLDLGSLRAKSCETRRNILHIFYTYSTLQIPLETSEMNILGKMLLLVNRWLAQIHLVAPGGPREVVFDDIYSFRKPTEPSGDSQGILSGHTLLPLFFTNDRFVSRGNPLAPAKALAFIYFASFKLLGKFSQFSKKL